MTITTAQTVGNYIEWCITVCICTTINLLFKSQELKVALCSNNKKKTPIRNSIAHFFWVISFFAFYEHYENDVKKKLWIFPLQCIPMQPMKKINVKWLLYFDLIAGYTIERWLASIFVKRSFSFEFEFVHLHWQVKAITITVCIICGLCSFM